MNAYHRCKATQRAVYRLQQLGSLHTAQPVQTGLWDAIKRTFGVSEEKIIRHNAYKYAEDSARAGLAEQLSNTRGSLKPEKASANLNSDLVADETMKSNMTSYKSWKLDNADMIEEREELEKEEKPRMGKTAA